MDFESHQLYNNFYLGNYDQVLELCQTNPIEIPSIQWFFQQRASLKMGKTDSLQDGRTLAHKAVSLLHNYQQDTYSTIVKELEDPTNKIDGNDLFIAAVSLTIAARDKCSVELYQCLESVDSNNPYFLEASALLMQMMVKIHRTDLANQILQRMKDVSDDSIVTVLAECFLNLYNGSIQEALHIVRELKEIHGSNPFLDILQAICLAKQHEWESAHQLLLESNARYSLNKEILATIAVVSGLVESGDWNNSIQTLANIDPDHALIADINSKSSLFDQCAGRYGK